MKDNKTIVILYSKGLYDTIAIDLADAIRSIGRDCHVIAIADDKYTNFGKGRLARCSYRFSIRNARWMYSLYSKMTAKKKAPNKALKNIKADPVSRVGVDKFMYDMTLRYHKVKNILRRYEPDIVLCFTANALKQAIKANEQLRMYTTKVYACISDFAFDMRYFNRRCAGYIVQNEEVKSKLVSLGVEESKTYVTGLLASNINEYSREQIKSEIGIRNNKPNLLLVGGRYGANIIKTALSYLVNYTDNFNIIVLTGGSNTIVNVAKHVARDDASSVFVIDEIDDVSKVYAVADIVVATPTTCILSETLSCKLPLILLKGAGNVEQSNATYLVGHGYAYDGATKEKLLSALTSVILEPTDSIPLVKVTEIGSIDGVASHLYDRANDIFELNKIIKDEEENAKLLAEEDIVQEVDENNEVVNDISLDKKNVVADDAIIDEYNDVED